MKLINANCKARGYALKVKSSGFFAFYTAVFDRRACTHGKVESPLDVVIRKYNYNSTNRN